DHVEQEWLRVEQDGRPAVHGPARCCDLVQHQRHLSLVLLPWSRRRRGAHLPGKEARRARLIHARAGRAQMSKTTPTSPSVALPPASNAAATARAGAPSRLVRAAISPASRGAAKDVPLQRAQPRKLCGTRPLIGTACCDSSKSTKVLRMSTP